MDGSKRSKIFDTDYIASDACGVINLNDDDTVVIPPPSCPMGMDKVKHKGKDKAST